MLKRLLVILGILALLAVGALGWVLFRLDALLTGRAQAAATEAEKTLGRTVSVRGVDVSLFPPLRVEVRGIEVGPGDGETKPLLVLDRVTLQVDALAAARSEGKVLRVDEAVLGGLTVNVLRFADGTTNVERLMQKLETSKSPAEAPPPAGGPQAEAPVDLSGLWVRHAALLDGRFALTDMATPGAKELAISDLDVELRDLQVGKPLECVLKAAVLSSTQNFEVHVKSGALPASFTVVPQEVTLTARDIDLGPLGPFLGSSVGLTQGTLDADWKLLLGTLVPGGTGPSTLQGQLGAKGLRFTGAELDKPLDVRWETDIRLDSVQGDADLRTLRLELGPAKLTGKGRVAKLWSGTPTTDGFELQLKDLDVDALATYVPLLKKQLAGQLGGVVSLVVRGEGSASAQHLVADLDLTNARLQVPAQLTKAKGAPLKVHADVAGAAAQKSLHFKVDADLTGVDLRPGQSLNKAPGQPFLVRTQGTYEGGASTQVSLESLSLTLLEDVLTGKATLELGAQGNPSALHVRFDGRAKRLDADKLLLPAPEAKAQAGGPAAPAPEEADPHRFDGMRAEVTLRLDSLRYGEQDLQDVVVELKMVDDKVTLEKMTVSTFGGRVKLDGSQFRLGPTRMPYQLNLQLEAVDVAAALAKALPNKKSLSGKLSGNFTLAGEGFTVNDLAETLSGGMKGDLQSGAYAGLDVLGAVTQTLAKAVPFLSKSGAVTKGPGLSLGNLLPFSMTVEKGVAKLSKPLAIDDATAQLTTQGGFKLNGDLALDGLLHLKPATVKALTGGKVQLDSPLPIPFKVAGPAWAPRVEGVDVKDAAKLLLEKAGRGALSQVLGGKDAQAEALAQEKAAAVQAKLEAEKAALEQRQAEERAKLESAAKAEAEKQKKAVQEQAKKKLKGLFK